MLYKWAITVGLVKGCISWATSLDPVLVIGALAAVGTFVLAVVTWYQAYEGGKTVREMKATREAEYKPQLRAFLNIQKSVIVFLKIINIGRAASVDIDLDVVLSKDKQIVEQRHFKQDAILPLEYTQLILRTLGSTYYRTW